MRMEMRGGESNYLRVEVDVVQDDGVRAGEVEPLAARARAQQEGKHARVRRVEPAHTRGGMHNQLLSPCLAGGGGRPHGA